MNIVKAEKDARVKFNDIGQGNCFLFNGDPYISIAGPTLEAGVCLSNGKIRSFADAADEKGVIDSIYVTPLDAEVVLYEKKHTNKRKNNHGHS